MTVLSLSRSLSVSIYTSLVSTVQGEHMAPPSVVLEPKDRITLRLNTTSGETAHLDDAL